MAALGTPQQTAAGREELAMLLQPLNEEQPELFKAQEPAQQQGGQLPAPQGQYPQVQLGGVLPQTWPWPQAYPVSHL